MKSRTFWVVLLLLVVAGCPSFNSDAAAKCHELADLNCTLSASCKGINKYQCIAGYNAGVSAGPATSCQDAVGVRTDADFEACVAGLRSQISAAQCESAAPPSCRALVRFE